MKQIILFIILSSTLIACNSSNKTVPPTSSSPQKTLDQHQQQWKKQGISHYHYTFQRSCHCLPDYTRSVVNEVKNNQVVKAYFKDDQKPLMKELKDNQQTIDYFFKQIQEAINRKAALITVKYNKQYGYPESIYVDYDKGIADEELNLYAKDFQPQK
ncbi:MAG: hypothetical protein KAG28_00190 [Cocleimonas sp.]|nr:hypothetical protein [Cocleimonas sp.]